MIYEYECQSCKNVFERWSNTTRDMSWTESCPDCGGSGKRIISYSSFVLKGDCWYRDGYQRGKPTSSNSSPKE